MQLLHLGGDEFPVDTLHQGTAALEGAHIRIWTNSCILRFTYKEHRKMLWTLVAIFLVLWLLGLATAYTMGGLIHILLVVALVVVVLRVIQGRRIA